MAPVRSFVTLVLCLVPCAFFTVSALIPGEARTPAAAIAIRTLSSFPDRISGGDALIEIERPPGASDTSPRVTLNGRDVSSRFKNVAGTTRFHAVLDGLVIGRNVLAVAGKPWGAADASLTLTNYVRTGPIISGPHVRPFVCQTDAFKLPDGTTLGAPKDENCTAATVVQYLYLPSGATALKSVPDPPAVPPDVAPTTTIDGRRVPFIVRVETGTINRAIYQIAVLDDPVHGGDASAVNPPPSWNHRLLAVHGTGCPGGWYIQGSAMGVSPTGGANVTRLGEGYAVFTSTLNHPSNSCNAFLAGETTMMVKERAIELLGVPKLTVSVGTSGGAYTSLQVADAFPGLFDGILINATFPDALSIALGGEDAHLLSHYTATHPEALTEAETVAVSGYSGRRAWMDAANQSQRTDPVAGRKDVEGYGAAVWNAAVPASARYDPEANRQGARPTVFDAARNIYGVDPATGFARRPFDNVGVQYGLRAFESGLITSAQFLDLNERIGGYDQDANYTSARSTGDADAIAHAYAAGLTLGGGGGLKSIPVFDDGAYNDTAAYHYQWFHFAIRERIKRGSGDAANHVMWRGPVQADRAWAVFADWVAAVADDAGGGSAHDKVVRHKPAAAIDGCWAPAEGAASSPLQFVAEPQTFSRQPNTRCNTAYPSYGFTRLVAGGPLDANVLKCQLKPIDPREYGNHFTPDELRRLRAIFPTGVCDFSKPGVRQQPIVTWNSFGPAPPATLQRF